MASRSQIIFMFVLMVVAFSVPFALSTIDEGLLIGGYGSISDLNDPKVQDAIRFELSVINKGLLIGGYGSISDLNRPEVQDAARFAVSEFNKQQGKLRQIIRWLLNLKPPLQYRNIVKGQSQLAGAINYKLVVSAHDGKSEGLYEALVHDCPWENTRILASFQKVQG